jgi:hypothetical protein
MLFQAKKEIWNIDNASCKHEHQNVVPVCVTAEIFIQRQLGRIAKGSSFFGAVPRGVSSSSVSASLP